jgi:hypothetical protein
VDWQARYKEMTGAQDAVAQALGEVKAVLRQEAVARGKVVSLHGLAVTYVARQDDALYAALRSRHERNDSVLKIIDFFLQDLKLLKVKLYIFEDTHLTGRHASKSKWVADVSELCQDLWSRLQLERDQLFPLLIAEGSSVAS